MLYKYLNVTQNDIHRYAVLSSNPNILFLIPIYQDIALHLYRQYKIGRAYMHVIAWAFVLHGKCLFAPICPKMNWTLFLYINNIVCTVNIKLRMQSASI